VTAGGGAGSTCIYSNSTLNARACLEQKISPCRDMITEVATHASFY
jgi:hypothetical protein